MKGLWKAFACTLATVSVVTPMANARSFRRMEDADEPVEIQEEDRTEPLWVYSHLWQGDIKATYEVIAAKFGQEYADQLVERGEIEPPQDKRQLDAYIYGSWTTRNDEGQVLIPYTFADGHVFTSTQIGTIESALQGIEASTRVIKFVRWTSEYNRIVFQSQYSGCWSYIGRVNFANGQPINLQPNGCVYTGIVQHEVMHALGMFHEQSRLDRDDYISVLEDNIISGYEHNFDKETYSDTLGVQYDFNSVMHYGATSFGKPRISCSLANQVCDQYTRIRFVGSGQDSTSFCITNQATLEECDPSSASQKLFLRRVGDAVEITDANDGTQCMYASSSKVGFRTCSSVDEERFQLHGSSLTGNLLLRWDGYNTMCLTRDLPSSSPTAPGTVLELASCSSSSMSFALDFDSGINGLGCQAYPLCTRASGSMTTIDSHGNRIGQRSAMSEFDVLQLQLLYQCPSGRRQKDALCDAECPCFEGQFSCNADVDCRGDLVCSSARVCEQPSFKQPTSSPTVQTSQPSKSPTRQPSTGVPTQFPTKAPVGPTEAPTTEAPTRNPTTRAPTQFPTKAPVNPTRSPSTFPTVSPTIRPTRLPTVAPTSRPTKHECSVRRRKQCNLSVCDWGRIPGSRRRGCYPKDPALSGPQEPPCSGRLNLAQAKEFCETYGHTVCSVNELQEFGNDNYCRQTRGYVWTSTSCSSNNDWYLMYRAKNGKSICRKARTRTKVRCCPVAA